MSSEPFVKAEFRHDLGSLKLDVAFRATWPWTVLFGPSGSGKSTILRALAGLVRPRAGRIVLGGQVVFDSEQKIWIPAHRRRIRWSPQRPMLQPNKSAGWNLRFGIPPSTKAKLDLQEAIRRFGCEEPERQADRLSGGERQRLAVIRTAATARNHLLLLDEPFTGMDAAVRSRLIAELRAWLGETPVMSVTHDVGEVFLLKAEVIRIAEGRVVEQGAVADVLAAERASLGDWLKFS